MHKATTGAVAHRSHQANAIVPADIMARVMIVLDTDGDVISAFPCSRQVPASLIDALADGMAAYADAAF